MSTREFTYIGTPPIRHDGLDKVSGRANYGADFPLPGMLPGVVVRSPHAHARILAIDTSAAEAYPGVKAVVTGQDIPKTTAKLALGEGALDLADMADNLIAHDKALYEGHAVAAVAATSLEAAREAARLVKVDYERLEPVCSIDQAIAPGAPILHAAMVTSVREAPANNGPTDIAGRDEFRRRDLDRAFTEAGVTVEGEFRGPAPHQACTEPH